MVAFPPQLKTMIPPLSSACSSAASVQLDRTPVPITVVGWETSTGWMGETQVESVDGWPAWSAPSAILPCGIHPMEKRRKHPQATIGIRGPGVRSIIESWGYKFRAHRSATANVHPALGDREHNGRAGPSTTLRGEAVWCRVPTDAVGGQHPGSRPVALKHRSKRGGRDIGPQRTSLVRRGVFAPTSSDFEALGKDAVEDEVTQ